MRVMAQTDVADLLMDQFLRWLAERPRRYDAVMEAWRSSCPRLSVWEDALAAGLVRLTPGEGPMGGMGVRLTAAGEARLRGGASAGPLPLRSL
jgi:hypothetical protein